MKKLTKSNGGARFAHKHARYGWYATVLTVLVIAVVIVLNVIVGAAEDKWALKIDASANSITSFTDETYSVLDNLDQEVHIYLLFQNATTSDLRIQLEEITAKYRARNNLITVDTIDPVTEPGRVNQYKDDSTTLSEGSIIVTNADESRVKLIKSSELYSYTLNQQTYSYSVSSFNGESKLTTAIMYVTNEVTPRVFFLTGHNEPAMSNFSLVSGELSDSNYEVDELTLGGEVELTAGDTVVIICPTTDLTDEEYQTLKDFLDNGGRMLYVNDPTLVSDISNTPNFEKLLDYYALGFKDGIVVEDESSTSNWLNNPLYLIPDVESESSITENLSGTRLIVPSPGAIAQPEMPLSGYSYENLLTTSDKAYVKSSLSQSSVLSREEGDEVGEQVLAMSVLHQPDYEDTTKDTRIVLFSSVYLLADAFAASSGNLEFSLSVFDWLVNRDVSVYIRSKSIADTTLALPNSATLWMLTAIVVVVIPAIVLIAGIWVWLRRRRL